MNFERLKKFVFLATLKNDKGQSDINISRAAERLHIPQSHLSTQIKQLEKELDVNLFVRRPRLQLTPYGEIFLKEAQQLLEQVQQLKISAKQAGRGEIGHLTIGINTSISNSFLPSILSTFRQKFPKVNLILQEVAMEESFEKLRSRTIDVDFPNLHNLEDFENLNFLDYELLYKEPLVMVIPENHPLADACEVQLQDFKNEPFVMPSHDLVPILHKLIRKVCLEAGYSLKVVQEATWMSTVLSLVAGGIGVTLLPANVINLQRTGVVYKNIQGQLPVYPTAIIWRREHPPKILSNFLEVVRQVTQKG